MLHIVNVVQTSNTVFSKYYLPYKKTIYKIFMKTILTKIIDSLTL